MIVLFIYKNQIIREQTVTDPILLLGFMSGMIELGCKTYDIRATIFNADYNTLKVMLNIQANSENDNLVFSSQSYKQELDHYKKCLKRITKNEVYLDEDRNFEKIYKIENEFTEYGKEIWVLGSEAKGELYCVKLAIEKIEKAINDSQRK